MARVPAEVGDRPEHLPLEDVAVAGGWKDVITLLGIYQLPDEEGVLAVMTETRKLREKGVSLTEFREYDT